MKPSKSRAWPLSLSSTPASRKLRILPACPEEALVSFWAARGAPPASVLPEHHYTSGFRHTGPSPDKVPSMLTPHHGQCPQCVCAGTGTTSLCTSLPVT